MTNWLHKVERANLNALLMPMSYLPNDLYRVLPIGTTVRWSVTRSMADNREISNDRLKLAIWEEVKYDFNCHSDQ